MIKWGTNTRKLKVIMVTDHKILSTSRPQPHLLVAQDLMVGDISTELCHPHVDGTTKPGGSGLACPRYSQG